MSKIEGAGDGDGSYLPPITEDELQKQERSQGPKTEHERGTWLPEDPRADPYAWTPALEPISEGSEESEVTGGSFQTALEEYDMAWEEPVPREEIQGQGTSSQGVKSLG